MTQHDPEVSLAHMRDYADEAIDLVSNCTRSGLDNNRILVLALTRLIEIIGEAANRVPQAIRDRYPTIPWRDIIGTRNRLIHGYDNVDLDILWTIVQYELPQLVDALKQ